MSIPLKYPFVSVVIPTFNAEQFIFGAIKSILNSSYPNFEVIVVDDSSTDRTIPILKKNKDIRLKIIQAHKKLMAAGARNKGCELAKGEYIALLDHDVEVDKNWLKELMAVFAKDRRIGCVQSRVLDIKQRTIIQHAGIKIQSYLGWVIPIGMGENANKSHLKQIECFANATGLIFKKSVWKKLGGFDEYLSINTDDWDFNWRCWIYGYRQVLAPNAITYHWSKEQKTRDYWIKRTAWEFNFAKVPWLFIKNYQMKNIVIYLPVYLMVNLLRSIINLIFRLNPAPFFGFILAIGWIIKNFPILIRKRKIIQSNRKISDQFIISQLMDNSFIDKYFFNHWLHVVKIGKNISSRRPYG